MINGLTIFPIQTDLRVWIDDTLLRAANAGTAGSATWTGGTGKLYLTSNDSEVAGSSFSLTFTTSSNGQFSGVMPNLALTEGTSYYLEVVLIASGGSQITYRHTGLAGYMGDDA